MELKNLLIDPKKAEGIWVDWNDAKIKVAPAEGKGVKDFIVKLLLENQKTENFDQSKFLSESQNKIIANVIIVDWQGLTMGGEPFEYSPENAEYLLERVPELLWKVNLESSNLSNFREEFKEAVRKNSKRS